MVNVQYNTRYNVNYAVIFEVINVLNEVIAVNDHYVLDSYSVSLKL